MIAEVRNDHGARLLICVISALLAILWLTRDLATWAVIMLVAAIAFFVLAAGYFSWRFLRNSKSR